MSNRNYPKVSTATTVIPFDNPVTYIPPKTITGATAFTKSTAGAQAGYCTILQVTANGVNIPDFSAFGRTGTGSYDNTNGVINVLVFTYWGGSLYTLSISPVTVSGGGGGGGDTTPPSTTSVSVENAEPNKVLIAYGETLDSGSVPATSAYTVTVNGTTRTISAVAITGANVKVTFGGAAVVSTDTITLDYVVPGTSPIQDVAGNDAAALTGVSAGNNVGSGGGTFTTTNRLAFYKNSSMTRAGGAVTKWTNVDGDTTKDWNHYTGGTDPVDATTGGMQFTGDGASLKFDSRVELNTPLTVYVLIKKTGDGALLANTTNGNGYGIAMFSSSGVFIAPDPDTPTYYSTTGTGVADMSAFKVLCFTWAGPGSPFKMYIDGVLTGTFTENNTTSYTKFGIDYLGGFAGNETKAYLNGMAFFNVEHDASTVATQSPLFKTAAEA
jgi:hypothetical protein